MIIHYKFYTLRTEKSGFCGYVIRSVFFREIANRKLFCEVFQPEGFKKIVEQLKLEAE